MRRLAPFAAAGICLLSSAAFAAEQKEGMPQLDFGNPLTISQIVWLAVIFYVLYRLLSGWALPQVAEVLENRAAIISRDLEAARQAKVEADAAVADLTQATQKAHAAAQAEIAGAVDAAKKAAAAQAAALNERLDAQLAAAEQRIDAARTAAMGALRQVATETTKVVVTRLTGRTPKDALVDTAVGTALAARGQA
ncbi:ATP synthase subunit b 1 [Rhodovastum atsumiense]|uniref:ATP synthase subunit b n=1 Tax=Rhodovastum atsumiense TaxID=504468 RepID=A0A5M6IZH2_9PROT|nr:F0F1 ATP synthase subunit B' [Rhodovastum atsumiense]KAA5613693.1 F0F1 ATP synthase subunit B' [Rhodovastum atsumiense]CAH2599611.1 ATP synthase subunit b 1 [Rhodovastum atsumiense]